MLAQRGVVLTYETIRAWCLKFGQTYANNLDGDLLDPAINGTSTKCSSKINGRIHYLWRAVDQDGEVLDIMVQSKREKRVAKKSFRKLLKRLRYVPRVIITEKLKRQRPKCCRYRALLSEVSEQSCRELTSTNEIGGASHETVQVSRPRAAFSLRLGIISSHFRLGRHRYSASSYRAVMKSRFALWDEAICEKAITN